MGAQFQIVTKALSEGVASVAGAVDSKCTIRELGGILFEVSKNKIRIEAANLEHRATALVSGVEVFGKGRFVVSAKQIRELLKNESGTLTAKENSKSVTISTEVSKYRVPLYDADAWPTLPVATAESFGTVSAPDLSSVLRSVLYASSSDPTRMVLNGLLMQTKLASFSMVATDGRRLAINHRSGIFSTIPSRIFPMGSIKTLIGMLPDDGDVELSTFLNNVVFTWDRGSLSTVLIEGEYPNYSKVFPKGKAKATITGPAQSLINAVVRAASMAGTLDDGRYVTVEARPNGSKATVFVTSVNGVGLAKTEATGFSMDGDEVRATYLPEYLMDALTPCSSDDVEIRFGSDKPLEVRDREYRALVMPIRTGNANESVEVFEPEELKRTDADLLAAALQVIRSTGRASATIFTRKLKVDETELGRLLEKLEETGVIGPPTDGGAREVLIDEAAL